MQKLQLLQTKERIAVPIMTHPGIELCGHTVYEAVTDGNIHSEAVCELSRRFPDSAAATAIMDLTVEAEAFGSAVQFSGNDIPNVTDRIVSDLRSATTLPIPDLTRGRIPEFLNSNRKCASAITDKPILGGCCGPFTLAGRLMGLSELMMSIYLEQEMVERLMEKCTTFITSYLSAMKETGLSGVIMAEPSAGLVSADDCLNWSSMYVKRIVDAIQDDNFIIVLHNCGTDGHCLEAMLESGAAALHFGNKADMVKILQKCPNTIPVMGNVDPVGVMKMGTTLQVRENVLRLLEDTSPYSNFILSTGCDVPPGIPVENIGAFYSALGEFNGK